jgi:hypothetical protein
MSAPKPTRDYFLDWHGYAERELRDFPERLGKEPEPQTSSQRQAYDPSTQKEPPIATGEPVRVPVDYRYDALNPAFLKMLARIGSYADAKYGSWSRYTKARLTGEKSPVNHIHEHLRAYVAGESYNHFDGDPRWHLAAVAYNAMMAFYYHSKWGPEVHPLHIEEKR